MPRPGVGPSRSLEWPNCSNARDLGGLAVGGGVTRSGFLVRSDSLVHLTVDGQAALLAYGVSTIIDLRSPAEVLGSPNPYAEAGEGRPAYRHLPLIDDATMGRLGEARGMLERYRIMLEVHPAAFGSVFAAIDAAPGAIVVHCYAGKDRTGLVAALALAVAGASDEVIGADFAESDVQLADRYEEWIAAAAPDQRDTMREDLRCPPERMVGVLEHLRTRWGGAEGYLSTAGVGAAVIERIRTRLV